MLDHITIRASDRAASELFYDTVLRTIGIEQSGRSDQYTVWQGQFSLAHADDQHPVTRRLHIGFASPSREDVDAFWRAGTTAGYPDDGPPGPLPEYSEDYYGAFLLDPDGNSVEAVHHRGMAARVIDHLWIGVAEVARAKRFYELAAPFSGFSLSSELPERVHFRGANASFGLVAREPAQNWHLAFEAQDNHTVDDFHRTLTQAGYADNGPPGDRVAYHPGYYGAFVLDPDGTNVEVVNHNR